MVVKYEEVQSDGSSEERLKFKDGPSNCSS